MNVNAEDGSYFVILKIEWNMRIEDEVAIVKYIKSGRTYVNTFDTVRLMSKLC